MIGLDTNVVVRYIMQDDARQTAKAAKLLESLTVEQPGFVSLVSVVELVWVLSSCYGLSRAEQAQAIEQLLVTKELVVDRAALVASAMRTFAVGAADFADCLIERAGHGAGCTRTMTFDIAAAKHAGMVLIA